MNERDYSEKSLTDYLLGALPDEQAERFDELSFTDDEFSNALKTAENNLIDAYLHNELSGETLEKFKAYYLSSPLRRKKVEFAKSLQIYAKANIVQSEAENLTESKPEKKTGFFSALSIFTNPGFGWAAACVLLILAVGGFWIISRMSQSGDEIVSTQETPAPANQNSPDQNENKIASAAQEGFENVNASSESEKETPKKSPTAEPSRPPKPEKTFAPPKPLTASFILTAPLRGAPQPKTLSFPRETALIMMTLESESDEYKTYQVTLVNQADEKLRRIRNVKIRNGVINVSFPADLLKSGIYSLVVAGINDDGSPEIISNYSFRAAPK
jgi:hypothetical protein